MRDAQRRACVPREPQEPPGRALQGRCLSNSSARTVCSRRILRGVVSARALTSATHTFGGGSATPGTSRFRNLTPHSVVLEADCGASLSWGGWLHPKSRQARLGHLIGCPHNLTSSLRSPLKTLFIGKGSFKYGGGGGHDGLLSASDEETMRETSSNSRRTAKARSVVSRSGRSISVKKSGSSVSRVRINACASGSFSKTCR